MSVLLSFPNMIDRREKLLIEGERLGQILFFTGVRIERHADFEVKSEAADAVRQSRASKDDGRKRRKGG